MFCSRRFVATTALGVVGVLMLAAPAGASAAVVHAPLVASGSIFSSLGHALLGSFSWTFDLASKFLLTTFAALVRLLIPRSWVHDGVQIMSWIVAVPNYAGQITTPSGAHEYGFGGINDLRDLFMWLGVAIAPLTLTHATARSLIDESEPVAVPYLRVAVTAAAIVLYPYLWSQAADLSDQVTHLILNLPEVTDGLRKLMEYAVGGVALGGWQLVDLGLMGAIGVALLGLIFMKVVLILTGALLYATGPLMIGLVATRLGHAIARAWLSAAMFLLGIGIAWAAIFAVGALLINDATTAGPLIAGNLTFGSLIGGVILAVAGLVSLWLCLKVAREAGGLLRLQLGGMLALGAGSAINAGGSHQTAPGRTTSASLRQFGSGVAAGATAAGAELSESVAGGRHVRSAVGAAASLGRRGLIGTAAVGARHTVQRAAGPAARVLGSSRAGAVAVRMARSGTAAYQAAPSPTKSARPNTGGGHTARRPRPRPGATNPAPAGSAPPRTADPVGVRSTRARPTTYSSSSTTPVSASQLGVSGPTRSRPATVTSAPRNPRTDEQPARPPTGRATAPRTTRATSASPRPARTSSTPPPPAQPRSAAGSSTSSPKSSRRPVRWWRVQSRDDAQGGR